MKQKKEYRKRNSHNHTQLAHMTIIDNITVGNGTYGTLDVLFYRGENATLKIGHYCSIANNVTFLLGGEHNYKRISTYPFKAKFLNEGEAFHKGNIEIGDDVWIGYGATILSGVTIGQGAVIGAKSIVSKDVPPYAIYTGNKVVKYRFSEEIIEKLLTIDFSNIKKETILEQIQTLYEEVTQENVDKILETIKQNGMEKN